MPKSLTLGNGNILVGFDHYGRVRDFYYPYVGLENHIGNPLVHRIGIYVSGKLSWISDGSWEVTTNCADETLASSIYAHNRSLGVELAFCDVVYNEKNILIRKITVTNKSADDREIKLFFNHEFQISESPLADTAYYDPLDKLLIHYKGRRVFAINAMCEGGRTFDDYSTGIFGIEGREGTFRDADDGTLSKNPIEHGRVDSALGISTKISSGSHKVFHYWIAVAETVDDVKSMNRMVIDKTPEHMIETTQKFWYAWVNRQDFHFVGLSEKIVEVFKKSLFIIRSHTDNRGAIMASSDSDMLQYGRDTYNYMWPRDGALTALALDKSGDNHVAHRFFEFCRDTIVDGGFWLHKYRADRSLGSSWHPWVRDGEPALPIQEDETALVLFALWEHYERSKDIEFIESIYNPVIKKAANFMVSYRDQETKLPLPSYDLWEEKYGAHTFTAASVYGALMAASNFAELLGKHNDKDQYWNAAQEIKTATQKHLYDHEKGYFLKMIYTENGQVKIDRTVDMSSVYGVFRFGMLAADDEKVISSMKYIRENLCCKTPIGGVPRYENDKYYRKNDNAPSNPWVITTMWLAKHTIAVAKKNSDLDEAREWLAWAAKHALESGVMSEQLDPETGEQMSAAPLTWSHSEFVQTVITYLDKLEDLKLCDECNPVS